MNALRTGLDRVLVGIVGILMVTLFTVVVLGVLYRKLGASLVWYDEVASILLAWLTYYGSALAALRRAHIGFDGLVQAMPRAPRVAVVLFGEVVVIAFFAVAAWAGWRVLVILTGDSMVSLPEVPTTLTQSVIPVGAALIILAQVASMPAVLAAARRGDRVGGH